MKPKTKNPPTTVRANFNAKPEKNAPLLVQVIDFLQTMNLVVFQSSRNPNEIQAMAPGKIIKIHVGPPAGPKKYDVVALPSGVWIDQVNNLVINKK